MNGQYILLALVIGAYVASAVTNEQKYQAKINHDRFKKIFKKQLGSTDIYVANIFAEIEKKVSKGVSVSGVKDSIHNLNDQLNTDQSNDDTVYKTKQAQLERDITEQELELERLAKQRDYLRVKLGIVLEEESNINSLWTEDHEAYEQRYAEQIAMKNVLEVIIDKLTGILLHDDTQSLDSVFTQLQKIGKGNKVEALVELSKVLTTGDIHDLVDQFVAFHQIVEETIAIDQEQEKENRSLYETLSKQIGEIKPDAQEKLDHTLTNIADGEDHLDDLEEQLDDLIFKYEKRKELRANAQVSASEAETQMENNLDKLVSWESTIKSGAEVVQEEVQEDNGGQDGQTEQVEDQD